MQKFKRIGMFIAAALLACSIVTAYADPTSEEIEARAWNKEFARINHLAFDAKQTQVHLKSYYLKIRQNNINSGGSYFKLPGEVTAPQVPSVTPTIPAPPTCTCNK